METYFWLVFFLDLVVPAVMIVVGVLMWKHPPRDINPIVGFRTDESMKSPQAWRFANTYAGKLSCWVGIVLLAISALVQLPFSGADQPGTLITVSVVLCLCQVAVLVLTIVPVQRALKKKFGDRSQ